MQYKVGRFKDKHNAQDFYTGSLKVELHPVSQGNPSLTLHYFKRFTRFTRLHFQNVQKQHTMTLESHKNQHRHNKTTLADLENHQAQPKSLRKTKPEW